MNLGPEKVSLKSVCWFSRDRSFSVAQKVGEE